MANDFIVVGIDIGTQKIRTVVSVFDEEKKKAHIIGLGVVNSTGIRKGSVIDVNEVINNITASVGEAEKISGAPVYSAFISIGGTHLESTNSKGIVAINGGEINENDVERVLEAAQAISISQNKRILRVLPREYFVDGNGGIKNPVGMIGNRLESDAHIITGQTQAISNLEKCIHQTGINISDFVPTSLAVSEAVLSRKQKELGVVSIDIGACCTTVSVFEEGVILTSVVLPIGGESVTNDIAIGLRTSIDTAEILKIEYGHSLPDDINNRDTIDLSQISKIDTQKIQKKQLAEIIQARYQEIIHMVKKELKAIDRDGMLPAGAILTGAAVKMPGVVDLTRDILGLPVQIGFPQDVTGIIDKIDDPAYATVVGLIQWGIKYDTGGGSKFGNLSSNFGKMFSGLTNWFKHLLP